MNKEEALEKFFDKLCQMSLFDSKDREKITKFLDEYAQQVKRNMWDDLATGGLICSTKEMRKGCIQCQTEYKKHCGDSNHQNQQ